MGARWGQGVAFYRQLEMFARPQDIAMAFSLDGQEPNLLQALAVAKEKGLLTLGLAGAGGPDGSISGTMANAGLDFCFVVPSQDAMLIQETHEILYHVLWELVHIFFEHEGLLI